MLPVLSVLMMVDANGQTSVASNVMPNAQEALNAHGMDQNALMLIQQNLQLRRLISQPTSHQTHHLNHQLQLQLPNQQH